MIVDLHTHSNCSDGSLSPIELIKQAEANQVDIFSITDHDNINAYQELAGLKSPVKLISGIEFSSTWRKIGIHIVGLNFDIQSVELNKVVAYHQQSRVLRAQKISEKLEKIGLRNGYEKLSGKSKQIGRPDFAQLLIKEGIAKDWNHAFKKYLGAGKLGDVKNLWKDYTEIISVIKTAGGEAVLAHPFYYKLSNSKLNQLILDFKSVGGTAIELVNGYQNADKTNFLNKLCIKHHLKVSVGSDFHHLNNHKKIGCQTNWIKNIDVIWNKF